MSTTAEFSVPIDSSPLHASLTAIADTSIQITVERTAGHPNTAPVQYIRAIGTHHELDQFADVLDEAPTLADFTVLEDFSNEQLYQVTWDNDSSNPLVEVLTATDGMILSAKCLVKSGTWHLRALFPDRDSLSTLHDRYTDYCDSAQGFTLFRVHEQSPTTESNPYDLTTSQYEALGTAFQMGYFTVPKKSTIEEVATELGITPQAVSQRLRQGSQNLIAATLDCNADPDGDVSMAMRMPDQPRKRGHQ